MAFPNTLQLAFENKLKAFCENRIPIEVRDKVKLNYEIKGNKITIIEERPRWIGDGPWTKCPIAQIRYDETSKYLTIFWNDRNSKWHLYTEYKPHKLLDNILNEIDNDPTGIFWG